MVRYSWWEKHINPKTILLCTYYYYTQHKWWHYVLIEKNVQTKSSINSWTGLDFHENVKKAQVLFEIPPFVTSKNYYLKKDLRFFLYFHKNQPQGGPSWWIYAWFGLHIFFLSTHAATTCGPTWTQHLAIQPITTSR